MRIVYRQKKFGPASLAVIRQSNEILEEYAAQGFDLTLRQLFYQHVSRGWMPNKQSEYKRLGDIVNDARMAGHIDWDSIVDRTRTLRKLPHWATPGLAIKSIAQQYANEKWKTQPYRVEVWIEKDALVGVISGICNTLDVPFFSCRGYTSQSEMWKAAQRLGVHIQRDQRVKILHLGDHDPSGVDMSRDIEDRLTRFLIQDHYNAESRIEAREAVEYIGDRFSVDRIALTMDQIEQYDPPPNPAKLTDSRGAGYVDLYGYESWELDALDPTTLSDLISDHVGAVMDMDAWDKAVAKEDRDLALLDGAADRWPEVEEFLLDALGEGN